MGTDVGNGLKPKDKSTTVEGSSNTQQSDKAGSAENTNDKIQKDEFDHSESTPPTKVLPERV